MAGLVPAIPIQKSGAIDNIEITGTRPVMTWEDLCSHLRHALKIGEIPRPHYQIKLGG